MDAIIADFQVNQPPLWDLAREYYRRTEEYDRTVCTGPMGRDGILPANGDQLARINKNADAVLKRLAVASEKRGHGREELLATMRQFVKSGELKNALRPTRTEPGEIEW